jgi:hypothetical protein
LQILLLALLANVHNGSICKMLFTPSVPAAIVNDARISSIAIDTHETGTAELESTSAGLEITRKCSASPDAINAASVGSSNSAIIPAVNNCPPTNSLSLNFIMSMFLI